MKFYYLIDSRGGIQAAAKETADLNKVDDDWTRFVLLADTDPFEICKQANNGSYGDLCVVANGRGQIFWEWFQNDCWQVICPYCEEKIQNADLKYYDVYDIFHINCYNQSLK